MSEELFKNQNDDNSLDSSFDENEEVIENEPIVSDEETEQQTENIDEQDEETEQPKSLFENKEGKEYTYGLKYDDIINGLTLLANSKKRKGEKTQDMIVYICTAVSFLTAIITRNFMAIVAVCLCLGYVYFKTMKPINYKRRAAKIIDARNDEYKAILYDNGIKIIENGNQREFLYNTLSYNDHKDLMLVTKDGLVMILPKRYFGEDVETIKETFKNNFKSYKE